MNQFKILTYNNGVGIVTDAILLKELIEKNMSYSVDIVFVGEDNIKPSDVGIWIQNFNIEHLNKFKKNIFFINEEWCSDHELNNLHLFNYVVCKTEYAKNLLKDYKNVMCLPFISKDYYLDILRQNKYLHFAGRSIQKNTELILKQSIPITVIDPYKLHTVPDHFVHINRYQTTDELYTLLNEHNIHICTSLYESWGHYLYEGLSTGNEIICSNIPAFSEQLDPDLVHFIPTVIKFDETYYFDRQNEKSNFRLRKSFYVNKCELENKLEDFKPIGKNHERRKLFKYIIDKNSKKLIEFFNSL